MAYTKALQEKLLLNWFWVLVTNWLDLGTGHSQWRQTFINRDSETIRTWCIWLAHMESLMMQSREISKLLYKVVAEPTASYLRMKALNKRN